MALFRLRAVCYFAMDHSASGDIIMSESYGRIFVLTNLGLVKAQRTADQSLCVCLVFSFQFVSYNFLYFRSKLFYEKGGLVIMDFTNIIKRQLINN
jgi:hypothetical protein